MSGRLDRISGSGAGEAENSHVGRYIDVPDQSSGSGSHNASGHSASEIAGDSVEVLKSEIAFFQQHLEGMQGHVEGILKHERSLQGRPEVPDSSHERAQEMKTHVLAQLDLAQEAIREYQKALWPDTGGKKVDELTQDQKRDYYSQVNSINRGVVVDLQDAINDLGRKLYGEEWKARWV